MWELRSSFSSLGEPVEVRGNSKKAFPAPRAEGKAINVMAFVPYLQQPGSPPIRPVFIEGWKDP
jgi:hypothetical protein